MLTFRATFHAPFAVSTGTAQGGIDATVDPDELLPASAVKGRFRAELVEQLGIPETRVAELFGDAQHPSRWRWTCPLWDSAATALTSRVKIGEQGVAERGFLAIREVVWASAATWQAWPTVRAVPAEVWREDELLLRVAARSITSLGSDRLRGQGRVRIVDIADDGSEREWTDADTRAVLALRGGDSS
ncbi:MAG: hypothetical protein R2731_05095 [Nocardioides sp.]